MNNTVQIFKRLIALQSYTRVINSRCIGSREFGGNESTSSVRSSNEENETDKYEKNEFHALNKNVDQTAFLEAFKKQEEILSNMNNEETSQSKQSSNDSELFTSLLRQSPFIDMGDPVGKVVLGKIYLVVGNDLYIDFGWKFHTVCPRPRRYSEKYVPGMKVLLKIRDLELSARFLGDKNYVSLLEADCDILGIIRAKKRN